MAKAAEGLPAETDIARRLLLAADHADAPMTQPPRARLLVALVLFVAGACVDGCAAPAPPTGVVVITLDTTRADRLSPYGFMNVSLPAAERLAREGVVFDAATSVAPITLPAHTSLFTGLRPPRHGVRDNADSPLAERFATLAEVLGARGFLTGGFVSSIVLDPDRGLAQGFQTYAGVTANPTPGEGRRQRRGDAVVDDALEWIERIGDGRTSCGSTSTTRIGPTIRRNRMRRRTRTTCTSARLPSRIRRSDG